MSSSAALLDMPEELSCVVIPTGGMELLLPNICVAEIVPWRRVKVLQNAPDWCLGLTGWRGQTIPVVHYDGFREGVPAPDSARCLVVMNRSRSASGRAFYALAARALPYMVQLAAEDMSNENSDLGPADVMSVRLGESLATIPDLQYVENLVTQLKPD